MPIVLPTFVALEPGKSIAPYVPGSLVWLKPQTGSPSTFRGQPLMFASLNELVGQPFGVLHLTQVNTLQTLSVFNVYKLMLVVHGVAQTLVPAWPGVKPGDDAQVANQAQTRSVSIGRVVGTGPVRWAGADVRYHTAPRQYDMCLRVYFNGGLPT